MSAKVAGTLRVPSAANWMRKSGRHAERACCFSCLLALAIAFILPAPVLADENSPPVVRFRKVYVPEDPKTWPASDAKYLPMNAGEFARLISKIERQSPAGSPLAKSQPQAAYYEARLSEGRFLLGSGTLEIPAAQPAMSTMTIDRCNLALDHPQWLEADSSPAAIGLSSDGKLQLLVEHTGPMLFDWSLAPEPGSGDLPTYTIDLPGAAVNRFQIDLPDTLVAHCEPGMLVRSTDVQKGSRRWQFELGGQTHFRLSISSARPHSQQTNVTIGRQTTTYDLSLRGLETIVQWRLERRQEPLDEVIVALESPLTPVMATFNGEPAAWSVLSSPQSDRLRLRIAVPQSMRDNGGLLRLKAIASLENGKAWKLPRITAEGVFWQGGQTTLIVASPLQISRLATANCRQVDIRPMPPERGGDSLDFESYASDSSITVTLNEKPASILALEGVSTSLDGGKFLSRVVSNFQTAAGSQFVLQATVLQSWSIDSIQTSPAEALDDWTIETRGKSRVLVVRLLRPLAPERPLGVTVVAHRPHAASVRNLSADDVVPLRYLALSSDRRLVTLHSAATNPLQLETVDPTERISSLTLAPAERDLFTDPPVDPMFLDNAAAAVHIAVGARRSAFDATILTTATVSGTHLAEDYVVRCTPAANTQLDRIVMRFNQHRTSPPHWTIAGLDKDDFAARSLGSPNEADEWELTLRRPQKNSIEISAHRESPLTGPTAVSLASLPDAATQRGQLVIASLGPRALVIRNIRLTAVTLPGVATDKYQTARATYSYDPRVEQAAGIEPPLFIDTGAPVSPTAWCSDCHLQSRYALDGAVEHVVSWRIERTAVGTLLVALPAGWSRSNVRSIWVDHVRLVPGDAPTTSSGQIAIDLPDDKKSSTVEISLSGSASLTGTTMRLHSLGRLQPVLPALNIPVLATRWAVWLPAGYQVCGGDPTREPLSLGQRLCGWFGRDADETTFNPFSRAQWATLFHGPAKVVTRVAPVSAPSSAAPAANDVPEAKFGWGESPGWDDRSIECGDGSCAVFYIYRPAISATAWLGFLASFGLGVWQLARRPRVAVFLAAASAIAALLAPPPCTSIFSSLLLGFLCTLMWSIVAPWMALRRKESALRRRSDSASTVSAMLPFGAPLLAALLLTPVAIVHAAQPADDARRAGQVSVGKTAASNDATTAATHEATTTYDVLIPIDAKQKPVGNEFYLPEELYKSLYQDARQQNDKPQGAMITSALYRTTLALDSTSQAYTAERLTAEFNVRAFGTATHLRVPLRRDEIKLAVGQIELDGRTIQPEWETDGAALSVDLAEAGEHRLEIGMQPAVRNVSGATGFQIAIPRVATARAEVQLMPRGPLVEFPGARGSAIWEEGPARWTVQLGPVDHLAVRWPEVADAATPIVDAEQLLWLRVLPGSVLVDVKVNLKMISGRIDRLQIKTDPDLELLPPSPAATPMDAVSLSSTGANTTAMAPTIDVQRSVGQSQLISLRWPRPIADASSLDLHFLWTGASSVGSLRAPLFELTDVRSSRRWLAVSVDPALEHTAPAAAGLVPLAVSEFASAWKSATPLPQYAFQVNGAIADASFSTRPRHAETIVEQSALLTCGERQIAVALEAQLTTSGNLLQYSLQAPKELQIQSIDLDGNHLRRLARWSQDASGEITVFTNGPVMGQQQFRLRGSLPVRGKIALPRFRFNDSTTSASMVRIERRTEVLVDLHGEIPIGAAVSGAENVEKEFERTSTGSGPTRFVRALRDVDLPADRMVVQIQSNRPKIEGIETTWIDYQADHWQATVDCRLKATGGAVDSLKFDAPKTWHEPLAVTGSVTTAWSDDQPNSASLVVTPSGASNQELKFTITGQLSPGLAGEVGVPDVVIDKSPRVRRLVVLRGMPNDPAHPWAWTLRGLRKTNDPPPPGAGPGTVYEVVASSWQAVRSPTSSSTVPPRIAQQLVRIAWHPDGKCLLAARWRVIGAHRGEHTIMLPEGFSLLRLMVDDLPIDPQHLDNGAWVVPIPYDRPEIQINALCFAPSAFPSLASGWPHYFQFHAPKLGELAVEKTTWLVAGPVCMEQGLVEDAPPGIAEPAPGDFLAATAADFAGPYGRETHYSADSDIESLTLHYAPVAGLTWPEIALCATVILAVAFLAMQMLHETLLWRILVRRPYMIGVITGLAWWLWLSPSALGLLLAIVSLAARFVPWPHWRPV